MNRSILIVICDFLVSSMLSMMTGMIPAGSYGSGVGLDEQSTRILLVELESTRSELLKLRAALQAKSDQGVMTAEDEKEFHRLTALLAVNELKIEKLEELSRSTSKNTGDLSAEELSRRLEAEKLRRIEAEIRAREKNEALGDSRSTLQEARAALLESRNEVKTVREELLESRNEVKTVREELLDSRNEVRTTREELRDSRAKLQEAENKLSASEKAQEILVHEKAEGERRLSETEELLSQNKTELDKTRIALQSMTDQAGIATRRSGKLESDLAYAHGKLLTAERSLASSKDETERLRRELEQAKISSGEAVAAKKEMAGELQRTVGEWRSANEELKKTRAALAQSRASEERAVGKLQVLEKQLRSDVFARYERAAAAVKIAVGEKRVISDLSRESENFLPTVLIGGKTFVIGATSMFGGGAGESFHYRDVFRLSYTIRAGKTAPVALAGPLIVSKNEPRIAALEVPTSLKYTPLHALSAKELRERGVQQLYLFKASSLGKDSASLGDRCALDMQGKLPALIIRNTARGAMELKAQVGDFVLTREGDFVGVVVGVAENGRFQEARVVFCDPSAWNAVETVSLAADQNGFFRAFEKYMYDFKRKFDSR